MDANGRKTGGRKKGTPNKVTQEEKDFFRLLIEHTLDKAEDWLLRCAEGEAVPFAKKDPKTGQWMQVYDLAGNPVMYRQGADPGRAYDLFLKTHEFVRPKLQRIEKTLAQVSDEELLAELRRREQAKPAPATVEEALQ